jgi:hypothetical protein
MTPPLSHRPSPYECSDAKTVLKGAPQRSALAQAAMPVEAKGRGCRRMEKIDLRRTGLSSGLTNSLLGPSELTMSKQTTLLLAIAALVIGGIFILMPKSTGSGEQASAISTDILGLTEAAKPMPSEQYPAH